MAEFVKVVFSDDPSSPFRSCCKDIFQSLEIKAAPRKVFASAYCVQYEVPYLSNIRRIRSTAQMEKS